MKKVYWKEKIFKRLDFISIRFDEFMAYCDEKLNENDKNGVSEMAAIYLIHIIF